jgi:TolB-like protein/tetratricopeptide (TPR) repeat protein
VTWVDALAAFDELVGLDSSARQTRLNAIGATDPALLSAVERLLAADSRADAVLREVDSVLGDAPPDSDPLQLVGRTLSHFRIVAPVGRGGMGVVYRAEDLRLGRPVALKVPLAARGRDRSALDRFRQEAWAAAALDHPNLCPVFETGETDDGDLFYTMPLYEGETLKARLARVGRLPLAEALDVGAQIARGLGAAHQAGIVHRDLKPGNVMLLPDGSAKVLDFGLAKASDLTLTGSWAMLGTVAYMAPEQVQGHKVDPRADLWALGVVLYEMVTGARPFGGGHEIGVAHAILHQPPLVASELRDETPPQLDDAIATCLQHDPAKRWQTAEALAAALASVPLDQRPGRLRRFRRALVGRRGRWRTAVAVAAIAAAPVLVAAAWAGWAHRSGEAAAVPVSLAVLPFERLGDSAATQHLAIGLGDGIASELGRLRGVTVPGSVSLWSYLRTPRAPAQIEAELQVGGLLRGTVGRAGDRVGVEAQLLGAGDSAPIWERRYERPVARVREIQDEIVRDAVATLAIRPTREQQDALAHPATIDGPAYETYLQGRAVELAGRTSDPMWQLPAEDIRRAVSLYARARDLDPGFALARARLALMHTLAAKAYDPSEGRREQARVEAGIALRLHPGLPEGHEALAAYWLLRDSVATAIAELGSALEAFPNSAELRMELGDALGRAGRFDEALIQFRRAMQLDPRNANAAFATAQTYSWLRRRAEAMPAFDRAIALASESPIIKLVKGQAYLRWKGTADTLANLMEQVPPGWDPGGIATHARFTALMVQRRYADGLAMLRRSQGVLSNSGFVYNPAPLMRARFYDGLGDRRRARASYAAARAILRDSLDAHPDNPHIRVALGYADAGLGLRAEAVRETRRALELAPIARGSDVAQVVMGGAAEVFARAAENDAALELLELLFSMPAGREASVPLLRAWPGYDPLRSDPRFEQLLVRFAAAR